MQMEGTKEESKAAIDDDGTTGLPLEGAGVTEAAVRWLYGAPVITSRQGGGKIEHCRKVAWPFATLLPQVRFCR